MNGNRAGIRRAVRTGTVMLVALMLVWPAGCAGRKSPTRVDQAEKFTRAGWTLFTQEDYEGAMEQFDLALDELSEYQPAHLGRGWTLAFLREFEEARFALVTARELDPNDIDAWAGGAFVYSQLGDHDRVVEWAESALGLALQAQQNWVFQFRTSITHRHLHWTLAQSYWYRGSYLQCSFELDQLETGISHGTDPQTLLGHLQRLWLSPF
jgi:tetratricopeptide (TPR) repeat protein